jgi:hypothetical protein
VSISAIARGVLAGGLKNRETAAAEKERRRREQLENIELMDRLSNMEGFSFEDDEEDPAAPGASPDPVDELPAMPVEQISDGQGGPAAQQGIEPAIPPARERPKTAMEIARITIGGRERGVRFDPTQTPAAKRARRDQLNRAAHAASSPDEEYDEGRDYVTEQRTQRRTEAELDAITQAIIDSGIETDPKKARAWARANRTLERINRANAPKPPVRGTPEYNEAIEAEEDVRGRTRAKYREPREGDRETPAQKRAARLRSARGNAAAWAEGGRSADAIAGALARFYPDVSAGELKGIALDVVRAKERAAPKAGSGAAALIARAAAESGVAPAAATTPAKKTVSAADRAAAERDPEFREWLESQGYDLDS